MAYYVFKALKRLHCPRQRTESLPPVGSERWKRVKELLNGEPETPYEV